jgi:hypothetical protein
MSADSIHCLEDLVPNWKLKLRTLNKLTHGESSGDALCIELKHAMVKEEIGLYLWNIFIPAIHQRKGFATEVFDEIEKIADERELKFICIGPFVTECASVLITMCEKRNYSPFAICMIQQRPKLTPESKSI